MHSGEVGAGGDELREGGEGQVQEQVLNGGAGHGRRAVAIALLVLHI